MSAGIWFWLVYVLSILFGGGWYWRNQAPLQLFGPYVLIFYILFGLCGWGIWGSPIR